MMTFILFYFRSRRGKFIKKYFPDVETYRILDIGGSEHFWKTVGLDINPSNITLLNVSFASNENNNNFKKK